MLQRAAFLILLCCCCLKLNSTDQLWYARVADARDAKDALLRALFQKKGLAYPPQNLYLRVFKGESVLEVWASDNSTLPFTLVKSYPVCAMSGQLGPKRREGDEQVPEGFYHISSLNPFSAYHLSMEVSYPNASDRQLSTNSRLGGNIYIHGNCKSIGCIAITDPYIEEVYWLVAQARANGQVKIPVHLFPARMSDLKFNILQHLYRNKPTLLQFWSSLKQGYDYFQYYHRVPAVGIDQNGYYFLQ